LDRRDVKGQQEVHHLYTSPNVQEDEGRVARMRREMHVIGYRWEIQKERRRHEDQDVCGKITLSWISGKCDGTDWFDLTQDSDQWRAVVNTVMNLWVKSNVGKSLGSRAIGGFYRRDSAPWS
jgi:hypothetical protein